MMVIAQTIVKREIENLGILFNIWIDFPMDDTEGRHRHEILTEENNVERNIILRWSDN